MFSSCFVKLIIKVCETTLQYFGNLFKHHLTCFHYTARASTSWHLRLCSGLNMKNKLEVQSSETIKTLAELLVFSHLVHFRILLGSTNSSSKGILRSLSLQNFAPCLHLPASKIIGFPLSAVFRYHLFSLLPNTLFPPLQQRLQNNHDQRRPRPAA